MASQGLAPCALGAPRRRRARCSDQTVKCFVLMSAVDVGLLLTSTPNLNSQCIAFLDDSQARTEAKRHAMADALIASSTLSSYVSRTHPWRLTKPHVMSTVRYMASDDGSKRNCTRSESLASLRLVTTLASCQRPAGCALIPASDNLGQSVGGDQGTETELACAERQTGQRLARCSRSAYVLCTHACFWSAPAP